MLSAYDNIKAEHLNLLDDLARLNKLFQTIPLAKEKAVRQQQIDVLSGSVAAAAAAIATETVRQEGPVAQGGEPLAWPERQEALDLWKTFTLALTRHFAHEEQIIFTALLMTMPTKAMCAWVLKLQFEHGQVTDAAENLAYLFSSFQPPLAKCWHSEIARIFERTRSILLAHAVEEDAKFEALLRNNPGVAANIKKLLSQRLGGG